MTKLKIYSFSKKEDPKQEMLPAVSIEALVIKESDEDTFSQKNISGDHFIIMSEYEYRQKIYNKKSKKTNPLIVNFEEYEAEE
jgi:hypothetical protein